MLRDMHMPNRRFVIADLDFDHFHITGSTGGKKSVIFAGEDDPIVTGKTGYFCESRPRQCGQICELYPVVGWLINSLRVVIISPLIVTRNDSYGTVGGREYVSGIQIYINIFAAATRQHPWVEPPDIRCHQC